LAAEREEGRALRVACGELEMDKAVLAKRVQRLERELLLADGGYQSPDEYDDSGSDDDDDEILP
jgi:hypothetical protein